MACTTILVGKNASYSGGTLVARTEDSPSGIFSAKRFIVQERKAPYLYKCVLSREQIELGEGMRCTMMPNADKKEGVWGAYGVNEANVAMTATETITSNPRVLAADPLFRSSDERKENAKMAGGIGEEDFVSLILPFIHSAREGVLRLGSLLEKHGTYEMNGIALQDENEIWWLETIGGHHWIARRVKDDAYVIMPNQLGIDSFDFDDAYGEGKNHLCSADMRDFILKNHLDLSTDGKFNARLTFGSHDDADYVYNTPRAWVLQRFFNPSDKTSAQALPPDCDNIPWERVPERKITTEDIKWALSCHYQGTPYDPYGTGSAADKKKFRPIGINRNNVLGLVEFRVDRPEPIKALEWMALGSCVFNAMVPFYTAVTKTPAYVGRTTTEVTTDDFYWTNRIIGALADAHFAATSNIIERYQNEVAAKVRGMINRFDGEFMSGKIEEKGEAAVTEFCEKANAEIADEVKKLTLKVLDKVLYTASLHMKNGFSRSDA